MNEYNINNISELALHYHIESNVLVYSNSIIQYDDNRFLFILSTNKGLWLDQSFAIDSIVTDAKNRGVL